MEFAFVLMEIYSIQMATAMRSVEWLAVKSVQTLHHKFVLTALMIIGPILSMESVTVGLLI